MEKNSIRMSNNTTDELIKYLYKESTAEESADISNALREDWNLRDEYYSLKESMQHLDSIIEKPRRESVNAILEYARSTSEVEQP